MTMNTTTSPRNGAMAKAVLPQRKAPVLTAVQRQPFQVLQTGRPPAQLSLFLRPTAGKR